VGPLSNGCMRRRTLTSRGSEAELRGGCRAGGGAAPRAGVRSPSLVRAGPLSPLPTPQLTEVQASPALPARLGARNTAVARPVAYAARRSGKKVAGATWVSEARPSTARSVRKLEGRDDIGCGMEKGSALGNRGTNGRRSAESNTSQQEIARTTPSHNARFDRLLRPTCLCRGAGR